MQQVSKVLLAAASAILIAVAAVATVAGVRGELTWRIGLEAPLSGSQAVLGQGMLKGAQLAAEEINANGGLMGRNVEVVTIDDAADPDTGTAAAKAAIADGLDGIVGPYNSGVGVNTLPLYHAAGLVPVRLTSATATEGQGVTLQPMESQIAPVATEALSGWLGAKSVAITYDQSSDYTKGVAASVRDALKAEGVEVKAFTAIDPGKADYSSTVDQLVAAKTDAIYTAVYYPEAGLMAKELVAAKATSSCLMDYAAYDSGFVEAAGSAATHCPVLGVPAPDDFAGSSAHVSAYRARFNAAPGTWSPYTYDSLKLLVDAARRAKGFDAGPLKAALYGTEDWRGWTGVATIEAITGNRTPASVVVTQVNSSGSLHVDADWAKANGYGEGSAKLTLLTDLTSQGTTTHQVAGGTITYGRNLLTGSATAANGPVAVEMIGNVDYTNGAGPFFGFVTFTWPDGSSVGTSMDGSAKPGPKGSTFVSAGLRVIGGTGRYANVTGSGTFEGARTGAVGSPVASAFMLNLS